MGFLVLLHCFGAWFCLCTLIILGVLIFAFFMCGTSFTWDSLSGRCRHKPPPHDHTTKQERLNPQGIHVFLLLVVLGYDGAWTYPRSIGGFDFKVHFRFEPPVFLYYY